MLVVVLLFAATLGCTLGNRVQFESDTVEASSAEILGSSEAAWTLSFQGVPCFLPDDLSSLGVFANGLKGSWDLIGGMFSGKTKVSDMLVKEGREIASTTNCKRCNIELMGSAMPVKVGKLKPHISASMKCAIEQADKVDETSVNRASHPKELADICFRENGNLGKFVERSPRGPCAPCPEECLFGCMTPGKRSGMGHSSSTWFKCITPNPAGMAPAKNWSAASLAPNKDHFMLESGYECEGSTYKKLSREVQTILMVGGNVIEPKTRVPNVYYSKNRKGMWNLWCMYKDHTASLTDEAKSGPLEGSTWMLDTGISSCTIEQGSLSEDDSSFSSFLAKSAATMMQTQAERQNCLICNTKFGGSVAGLLSFPQSTALTITDLTGKASFDADLWAKAECAIEDLGAAACNPKMGSVGWSKLRPCMPCPQECMRCSELKEGTKATFKCVLLPPVPSLKSLTEANSGAAPENLYKLPAGLNCETPTPRNCDSKSFHKGWCKPWQFKTTCEFPSESHSIASDLK